MYTTHFGHIHISNSRVHTQLHIQLHIHLIAVVYIPTISPHTVDGCEILHQLVDGLSPYNHIIDRVSKLLTVTKWCRMSSIHSITCFLTEAQAGPQHLSCPSSWGHFSSPLPPLLWGHVHPKSTWDSKTEYIQFLFISGTSGICQRYKFFIVVSCSSQLWVKFSCQRALMSLECTHMKSHPAPPASKSPTSPGAISCLVDALLISATEFTLAFLRLWFTWSSILFVPWITLKETILWFEISRGPLSDPKFDISGFQIVRQTQMYYSTIGS